MRRKVIFEQERKIRSVQDIVKKQKEALHRNKKQQAQESEVCRALQVERFSDASSKTNYPAHSSSIQAEAQRHRVEALKKTISSLNARVKIETIRLGITDHEEALTHTRPTADKHETADRKTQTKKINNEKESVSINGDVPMKKDITINVDEQPVMCALQNKLGTSDQGDASESTESTSKEGKSLITKPGIIPAARGDDKLPKPKPVKKVKSPLHKIDAHSKVSPKQNTEIHSGEKVHQTRLQDVHHFTSEHKQPSCGTAGNPAIVSCLSSDIDEDLPYDYEDINPKPQEQTEPRFQETLKPHSSSFEMTVDCSAVITDNLTLNVQNSHGSQNMVFNNNHEICDVSRKSNIAYTHTYESDLVSHISESLKWQNIKDSLIDKPLVTNAVHAVSSDIKRTDSPSCDDSLSEAEDKSEPFSPQSEGLVWSEEEKDVHSEDKSEAGTFSLVYAEKFTVIPELPPYYNDCNTNHCEVDPYDLFPNEKLLTAESNLSEILSPVDEVLSYGSAELPPSLKSRPGLGLDINILPLPLPAFEIITWTSEEDLPAAPDFLEDTSINSENIPPLPVDLSCRRDVERPDETNVNNDDNTASLCQMFPTAEQYQEDEGSEYTNSLRDDDSNEDQDPLSYFNIGDRVLVYNSRQGVLKYKGSTAFADGFWAGVALDTPNGNHDGTFRGVKYFTCDKSCGILVRAEDISHLHIEHCNIANTGTDKEKFSDEDPPSNNQDGENGNKPFKKRQRRQSGRHCSPGHDSSAPEQTLQQEACEKCDATDNKLTTFSASSEKTSIAQQIDCTSHLDPESEALIERLTEEIFADALKNIKGTGPKTDAKPKAINFKKKETGNMINKPRLMDKWQQVYPASPPQIRVKPHEHSIVYRLVDCTVETLCGQENESALNACETPNYLVDDESRKTYRQVLFQLVSDILHKICGDILEMSGSFQKTGDKSKISLLQTRQISVKLLKNAVKRETQKVLHLEQTDQEMTEMLQTLCKYWYAKRDRVDYILIQELHNEEKEWVDYTNDQITVKMRLTDEIFSLLLDDTISHGQAVRLYTEEDPLVILNSDILKQTLLNSSAAWLVQFYSSWCGHCIQYSPTWKALAGDVKDWSQAIRIGVLDCANEKNFDICKEFSIHFYPTFRYFKAHSTIFDIGKTYRGADREIKTVRQLMVNFLQNHTGQDWPAACPSLEPARTESIQSLVGLKSDHYTAVIIEDEESYIGREVMLDLMPYDGVVVKRALNSEKVLMEKLGITPWHTPAAYLFYPNGTHAGINVQKKIRFFFSSFLKLLPGVHRKQSTSVQQPEKAAIKDQSTSDLFREFDKSKVYMVDLESGLHYLLRVELAAHKTLEGAELKTFKDFVTVVAKLFPGRQSVVKLLETLLEWLISLPLDKIPYEAILDLANNKMRISGLHLSEHVQWLGCQGSSVALRGYPCSLWTLFHVLTVQAASRPDALANTALEDDPLAVLQTMRQYIGTFFGCRECGKHFEEMAQESMSQVKSLDEAVLWLWRKHNQVNARLA
ncbi:Sulfhydryl oxidase 2, partial [Clarias magur]